MEDTRTVVVSELEGDLVGLQHAKHVGQVTWR
jgi:hypothetical protein